MKRVRWRVWSSQLCVSVQLFQIFISRNSRVGSIPPLFEPECIEGGQKQFTANLSFPMNIWTSRSLGGETRLLCQCEIVPIKHSDKSIQTDIRRRLRDSVSNQAWDLRRSSQERRDSPIAAEPQLLPARNLKECLSDQFRMLRFRDGRNRQLTIDDDGPSVLLELIGRRNSCGAGKQLLQSDKDGPLTVWNSWWGRSLGALAHDGDRPESRSWTDTGPL